jgi:RNA polymerase sigma factor (sigma-70 family)
MNYRELPLFHANNIPESTDKGEEHPTPEQLLIREAAKYLTKKQKKVWEYANYERMTQDEIAEKLGIDQTTVRDHLQACEKRIAKWVKSNIGAYNLLKTDFENEK